MKLQKTYPNVEIVNLSHMETRTVEVKANGKPYSLNLPELFFSEIDFSITCPLPKVHCMTGITLSFKNQWGCLPDTMRLKNHYVFDEIISQVCDILKFRYAFLDGKYGLDNNGPMMGDPVEVNWFVASNSLGAFDRVVSGMMGFDWQRIGHLKMAEKYGFMPGKDEIQIIGDPDALKRKFTLKRNFWNYPALAGFSFQKSDASILFFHVGEVAPRRHVHLSKETHWRMKQIIQNYRTGALECAEVPVPMCSSDSLLVLNAASLVSIGTERSMIELGQKSLLGKAKARPDLVKRFLEKARKEGFYKTFQEALGRLDTPTALGYSSSGIVVEVGRNVHKISPRDRVACIGAGYASPCGIFENAGESLLPHPREALFRRGFFRYAGDHCPQWNPLCKTGIRGVRGRSRAWLVGVDFSTDTQGLMVAGSSERTWIRTKLLWPHNWVRMLLSVAMNFKRHAKSLDGMGIDAIILTVATKSEEPVNTAVDVSRYGGRIVCVGAADIHPQRNEMWHKEVGDHRLQGRRPGNV